MPFEAKNTPFCSEVRHGLGVGSPNHFTPVNKGESGQVRKNKKIYTHTDTQREVQVLTPNPLTTCQERIEGGRIMSGTDFDFDSYVRERIEFEKREHNDSLGTFEVIGNHIEHSDRGEGADAIINAIEPMPEQAIPEAARAVLSAILDACRLHPQAGGIIAARVSNPHVSTTRELGRLCNLGKSVASEVIAKLRCDTRFAALFPATGKVIGQQRRRRREAQREQPMKLCRQCGDLFKPIINQRYCQRCRPEDDAPPARQRGAFYPSGADV